MTLGTSAEDLQKLTPEQQREALARAEQEADEAKERALSAARRLIAAAEEFYQNSWQAADALLGVNEGKLALFALQRAYFAVFNCCTSTAILLDIPLERYQQGSKHHADEASIPHSQCPVLAADLVAIIQPGPGGLGDRGRMQQTFELVRILQKYRKRADYMGCEEVSADNARKCIEWGKTLVTLIWGYACEHYDD